MLSLLLGGCSSGKRKQMAEAGVAKFHSQLDAERYHDIYVQSDPEFQKSGSEAEITEFLSAVHRKLGKMLSAEEQSFFVNFSTSGTIISLTYKSVFANGSAAEQFVWRASDRASLVSYRIDSRTLITK
jgi:hypothetical protein